MAVKASLATVLYLADTYLQFYYMQLIDDWLKNGKNFLVGSCIYDAVGHDNALKQLFEHGETDYAAKRLLEALLAINKGATAAASTTSPPAKNITKDDADKSMQSMPETDDAVLASIRNEWLPVYKAMNYKVAALDLWGTSNAPEAIADRKKLAQEILDLEQQLMKLWEKADTYKETGKLLDSTQKEFIKPTDPIELANAINTCKRTIRRHRTDMNKHPDKPKYAIKYIQQKELYVQLTGKHYEEKD